MASVFSNQGKVVPSNHANDAERRQVSVQALGDLLRLLLTQRDLDRIQNHAQPLSEAKQDEFQSFTSF